MNPYGLIIPASIGLVLIVMSYSRGGTSEVGKGFKESGLLFLKVLPNLCIGFTVAGFLMILLPEELIARHLGAESGLRGILLGTAVGVLTPGGPFTHFPIIASLMTKGAAIGPMASYISAWALLGIHRIIIWELPILGVNFVMVRIASSLAFPVVIGIIADGLNRILKQ
jgi:uncharacterized membrane protein YraQ (UPF0718 family)